jgi:hypothetical protein
MGFRIGIGIGKSVTCWYTDGGIRATFEKAIPTSLATAILDERFLEELNHKVGAP